MSETKHPLFCLENIYRAYRQCRRRKRNTYNTLAFEQNLEENVKTTEFYCWTCSDLSVDRMKEFI